MARTNNLGSFKLPQPTDIKGDDGEYVAIPRIARTIPFGYEVNPEDEGVLEPVILELAALELAREYVKQYSYRQVAEWLTTKTGRSISHTGLRKRLLHERARKNKAATLRKWAEYAQTAIQKAEALEETFFGAPGDDVLMRVALLMDPAASNFRI